MRIRIIITALIILISLQSCKTENQPHPSTKVDQELLTLSFPAVSLEKNERIVGLEITVTHGWVKAISNIPKDWSISLDTDLQWQPKVSGAPHHGVGALTDASQLQSVLIIEPWRDKGYHFSVEAKLYTTKDFEKTKTLSFQMTI